MNINKYNQVMKTTFLIGLVTLAMTATTVQAKIYKKLPKVMQGTWSMSSAKYCKNNDTSKLTITPNKLQFWESHAKVSNIIKKGNYITLSVTMTGEGETWNEKKQFLLKNNNTQLVHLMDEDNEIIRYRCIPR